MSFTNGTLTARGLTCGKRSAMGGQALQKEFAVAKKAKKEVDTRTKAQKEADEEYYWDNWVPDLPEPMWPDLKAVKGE